MMRTTTARSLRMTALGIGLAAVLPLHGTAQADVPEPYAAAIATAISTCPDRPGVTPKLVAAQIDADSNFNASAYNESTGTRGPAQFTASEWDTFGVDADHNGTASPFDISDAVTALVGLDCYLADELTRRGHPADSVSIAAARVGGIDNVDNPRTREVIAPIITKLST